MPDLFASTAADYARFRPGYPEAVLDRIRAVFRLDGTGRLLDVGCGTGELALAFRQDAAEIVGVDLSAEMLAEARRQSARVGLAHARWLHLAAEEIGPALGTFHLATLASSFHWMDREAVLARLAAVLAPGGGIAILGNPGGIWESEEPYEVAVRAVVQRWLGPERRTAAGPHQAADRHEVSVARAGFTIIERDLVSWSRPVDIETVLGELFSTSYANRALLGNRADGFAADVRRTLLALNPAGRFVQPLQTDYILARPPG